MDGYPVARPKHDRQTLIGKGEVGQRIFIRTRQPINGYEVDFKANLGRRTAIRPATGLKE
jgi:hypothetical protein